MTSPEKLRAVASRRAYRATSNESQLDVAVGPPKRSSNMKLLLVVLVAVLSPYHAQAQAFTTTVSTSFSAPGVTMILKTSAMETSWFTDRNGPRTVYSTDVVVGALDNAAPGFYAIRAHATWVINYNAATRTVNILPGKTHVTNWYEYQRCHVYDDGTCRCAPANANWTICTTDEMKPYVVAMTAMAKAALINADLALTAAGYTVTKEAVADESVCDPPEVRPVNEQQK